MAYKAKRKRKDGGKARTYHGKQVRDAMKGLSSFVVTQADIRRAKRNDPEKCAGACAIKRTHPEVLAVHMHRHFTYLEYENHVVRYTTPSPLRDQIIRHDVSPAKFELGIYWLGRVAPSTIACRGRQHSPPDRARGAVNSPRARKKPVSLGREQFRFA